MQVNTYNFLLNLRPDLPLVQRCNFKYNKEYTHFSKYSVLLYNYRNVVVLILSVFNID